MPISEYILQGKKYFDLQVKIHPYTLFMMTSAILLDRVQYKKSLILWMILFPMSSIKDTCRTLYALFLLISKIMRTQLRYIHLLCSKWKQCLWISFSKACVTFTNSDGSL